MPLANIIPAMSLSPVRCLLEVLMAQIGDCARFVRKAVHEFLICRDVITQDFERYYTPERGASCPAYRTISAKHLAALTENIGESVFHEELYHISRWISLRAGPG